jgi:type II secretory pathway pseudopilin PulG
MIELVIVIALIALLSAVVLATLSSARAKARDSQRLSDLRQLQTALEGYRTDRGAYPSTSDSWWGNCDSMWGSHGVTGSDGWIPDLAPTYIHTLPLDPKPGPNSYNCYVYRSDGVDYMVLAYGSVETKKTVATNPAPRPSQPTEYDFSFYTPGARNW